MWKRTGVQSYCVCETMSWSSLQIRIKTWILAVLLLSVGGYATGQQSTGDRTFRASALAGLNLSQIDGDDLLGFHQPGFNGGLRVVAMLSDKWRVGPEILYSQQGAKRNRNSINISDFRSFRLNAVEIPLMVYYKDWRLTAEAGVSYQRLINFQVTDSAGEDITAETPFNEDLFALKLGVTIYFTPKVGFNFRWSKHLNTLLENDAPRLKGRTISLRAVYTFGAGESLPQPPDPE